MEPLPQPSKGFKDTAMAAVTRKRGGKTKCRIRLMMRKSVRAFSSCMARLGSLNGVEIANSLAEHASR